MTGVRTFEVEDCAGDRLAAAKAGRTVSVCIPCRDEAATIGPLVSVIRARAHGQGQHRRRTDRARRSQHRRHGARRRARRGAGGVDRRRACRARLGSRQGQRALGDAARQPRRLRRLVRRRRHELRTRLGGQAPVAAARRRLGGVGEGAVPPADPLRRRRTDHRAGRPSVDVDVLPRADRPGPAAVGRVRRAP